MNFKELPIGKNRDMPISWDFDIQQERKNAALKAIYATLDEGMTRKDWTKDQAISYGAAYLQYTNDLSLAITKSSYLVLREEDASSARTFSADTDTALEDLMTGDYHGMKGILQQCADTWLSHAIAFEGTVRSVYQEYAKVLMTVISVIPDSGESYLQNTLESWKDPRFQAERVKGEKPVFEVIYERGKDNL